MLCRTTVSRCNRTRLGMCFLRSQTAAPLMSAGSDALKTEFHFCRIFLDGSISVAHCNVIFFHPFFYLLFQKKRRKKEVFDLNLQGGVCECYHYERNFNWNIIFQGSCTISETDNLR